jgi:hypothetical protein
LGRALQAFKDKVLVVLERDFEFGPKRVVFRILVAGRIDSRKRLALIFKHKRV